MEKFLDQLCTILEENIDLLDENQVISFQNGVNNVKENMGRILERGRVLSLGIVGEVKTGKSSFLNALLFDGKDVLPKAPTPMTAALTKISYSDTPSARVVFYSETDWMGIEKMSEDYDNRLDDEYKEYLRKCEEKEKKNAQKPASFLGKKPEASNVKIPPRKSKEEFARTNQNLPVEWRACHEVVQMAAERGINIRKYLGKDEVIKQNGNSTDYLERLNEYVGAKGHFTPIVKYTEIQMNNPNLEGIEVVDTPGLNDPVISRSRTTREFLINCDAVFLLSYCGQFLGAEDIGFIRSTLPNEGINKALLIGSKMDSAILQYPKRNATFRDAYRGTRRNCEEQARSNIEACEKAGYEEKTIEQIKQSLPPICTSSIAYSIASKKQSGEAFSNEEAHLIKQMNTRFSDFDDTVNTWYGLSSIKDMQEKAFKETKRQKDLIIEERVRTIQADKKAAFIKELEDISTSARENQNSLKNFDYAQAKEQLADMHRRLDSVRIEVKSLFENAALEAERSIREIMVEAFDEMDNHRRLEVSQDKRTEHRSSTSGHFFWKKTWHWDDITKTNLVEVRDVENNIRQYYNKCMRLVNNAFEQLIKIEDLKENIKTAVMKAFDQDDQNFDESKILRPLETVLKRITLPSIMLEMDPYMERLDRKLAGVVANGVAKNENIPVLKRAQDQVIGKMAEDIRDDIVGQGKQISSELDKQAGIFIDNIVEHLEGNQAQLQKLIQDKEGNLERYDMLIQSLREAKKKLAKV